MIIIVYNLRNHKNNRTNYNKNCKNINKCSNTCDRKCSNV